jgi:hypothetical protein
MQDDWTQDELVSYYYGDHSRVAKLLNEVSSLRTQIYEKSMSHTKAKWACQKAYKLCEDLLHTGDNVKDFNPTATIPKLRLVEVRNACHDALGLPLPIGTIEL